MKSIIALCALLFAIPANAVTYHYQGLELVCHPLAPDCIGGSGWSGSISIDESHHTDFAGSTLSLYTTGEQTSYTTHYTIGSTSGSVQGQVPQIAGLEFEGFFHHLFSWLVGSEAALHITFDGSGHVTAWDGHSAWGGSNDPGINTFFDSMADGSSSSGPGAWSTVVPLPASGFLLLGALMSGWAVRLRKP